MAKKKQKIIVKATKKAPQKKTAAAPAGYEAGRWNGHKFVISSSLIRGFTGLQIKGSSELEGKDDSAQGYVSRKGGSPTEVSLTVGLHALTGCKVRKEAMEFIAEAREGKHDYFYVGNKKLVTYELMLTEASVKEVEISSNGTWIKADVSLTLKQCKKGGDSGGDDDYSGGGSSDGYGSGSSKASVYSPAPKTTVSTTPTVARIASAIAAPSGSGTSMSASSAAGTSVLARNNSSSSSGGIAKIIANAVNKQKQTIAAAKTKAIVTTIQKTNLNTRTNLTR